MLLNWSRPLIVKVEVSAVVREVGRAATVTFTIVSGTTVTVNVVEIAAFPASSVALQVTIVSPSGKNVSDAARHVTAGFAGGKSFSGPCASITGFVLSTVKVVDE